MLSCVSWKQYWKWNVFTQWETYGNSNEQKIFAVVIDNKLTFKSHTKELFKKSFQKNRALCRLSSYLNNGGKKWFPTR